MFSEGSWYLPDSGFNVLAIAVVFRDVIEMSFQKPGIKISQQWSGVISRRFCLLVIGIHLQRISKCVGSRLEKESATMASGHIQPMAGFCK